MTISLSAILDIRKSNEKCKIHGVTMIYNPNAPTERLKKPHCPVCDRERLEKMRLEHDVRIAKEERKKFFRRSSLVGNRIEFQKSFDNFNYTKGSKEEYLYHAAKSVAAEYLNNPDKQFNTIFYGTPGEGKSHLAMSILKAVNDFSEPQQKCLYLNTTKLFNRIKNGISDPNEYYTRDEVINHLIPAADLIVLDDLGSENSNLDRATTNFIQEIVYDIANTHNRIIITTNLTSEQLHKAYSPRIISRLLAGTKEHTLDFSGVEDKRI